MLEFIENRIMFTINFRLSLVTWIVKIFSDRKL